tara:strand:- start:27 stop:305 length:279 start_codon:yes stop_codon:yes gene_type:complete
MSLILSSDLSSVIDEMSAIELANDIFFAIEEIPTKSRRVQYKLKNKYIAMLSTVERRAERLKWGQAIAVIRDGKAALVEILDELEKLSSWSI